MNRLRGLGVALMSVLLMACAGGSAGAGSAAAPPAAPGAPTDATPVAAAPTPPTALQTLPEGQRWRLVGSTVAGLEGGAETGIRIEFVEGRLTGDGGCNRFTVPASLDQGRLTFGILAATKRACGGGRMEVERLFFAALPGLTDIAMDGERLRLADATGAVLLFEIDPTVAE